VDLNCGQTLAVLAVNRVYFKDFFKFNVMLHILPFDVAQSAFNNAHFV